MRITFSARAWMLSAATGLIFLPSSPTLAQATRPNVAQRQPVDEQSGTASKSDDEKSLVQHRVDEFYARFGRRPTKAEISPAPVPAKEMLAKSDASKTDASKADASKSVASKSKLAKPKTATSSKSDIQQTSGEFTPASQEPGRLGETDQGRPALDSSRPATRTAGSAATATPTGVRQVAASNSSVTQSANQTEVQRRLEELYRKDGKQMPPMQMNQLPEQNLKVKVPPLPQQQQQPARQAQPVAQNRVGNFFKSISPFKPKENDERPKKTEAMPAESLRQQQLLQQQTQPTQSYQNYNQGGAAAAFIPPSPSLPPSAPPADLQDGASAPRLFLPENKESGRALVPKVGELPEFRPAIQLPQGAAGVSPKPELQTPSIPSLPNLTDAVSDAPFAAPAEVKKAVEKAAETFNDELGNSFPEMSETEADGSKSTAKTKVVAPKVEEPKSETTADESPFTGLKLDAAEPSKAPMLPEPSLKLPAAKVLIDGDDEVETTAAKPTAKAPESDDPQAAKLRKISERAELKGFKGFCPVVLRDDRDLEDARPQFKAVFLGKVYNLSSAEAREKFEKNPKLYAPAANGMDVVMSQKDGTEVEGMLDHAAWFRDRLYLFSNAKTKSDFEATPTKFVIE